jgi:acyl-CoA hydrolase
MSFTSYKTYHLVKSEDLNHHGTLYAGRTAEWFVESGFVAAASLTKPENVVCLKIHGMLFSKPVHKGDLISFESRVVYTGKASLVSYINVKVKEDTVVEGFITFIHVNLEGKTIPHNVVVAPTTDEEKALYEKAKALPKS